MSESPVDHRLCRYVTYTLIYGILMQTSTMITWSMPVENGSRSSDSVQSSSLLDN